MYTHIAHSRARQVDAFQGAERDIIIFSCVRSRPDATSVGFLDDAHRLNVALTRARLCCRVVGCTSTLQTIPLWAKLLDDAQQRHAISA